VHLPASNVYAVSAAWPPRRRRRLGRSSARRERVVSFPVCGGDVAYTLGCIQPRRNVGGGGERVTGGWQWRRGDCHWTAQPPSVVGFGERERAKGERSSLDGPAQNENTSPANMVRDPLKFCKLLLPRRGLLLANRWTSNGHDRIRSLVHTHDP
jgi:hypothetical protein